MLAKLNIFFSAIGFIFSFSIYTGAFLSPEIPCVLGAKNCFNLVLKPIFRNFALFLTIGFFLSFVTNFAKFFSGKEGYKIAVVTNLLFNLLTFLISGILLITAITSVETKESANVLAILVWAWSFINIVVSLLEMKPSVSQLHTTDTAGYIFAFSISLFILLSSIGSLIFSNAFLNRKNSEKLEVLSSLNPQELFKHQDFTPLLATLDKLREELKSSGSLNIDYSKMETAVKNAIISSFGEITGRKQAGEEEKPKEFGLSEFNIEDDYYLGHKDAPITIIEFYAFTCPYCVMLHPAIKEVLKKYPKEVKYIAKHFPLDFPVFDGGEAVDTKIAEVVEAAGAQNKYWEMTDKILEKFRELLNTNNKEFQEIHGAKDAFTKAQKYLKEIAKEIGVDYSKVEEALNKGTYREKIQGHKNTGIKVGVEGTPTVFINGKPFRGNWLRRGQDGKLEGNPEPFFKVIDEELKKLGK